MEHLTTLLNWWQSTGDLGIFVMGYALILVLVLVLWLMLRRAEAKDTVEEMKRYGADD